MLDNKPRLHQNGFIQYDLPHDYWLHIWPEALLPVQTINSPIHDHTFSFESSILVGTLHHIVYSWTSHQDGDSQLWGAEPWLTGKDAVLYPLAGMVGRIEEFERHIYPAGCRYQFRAGLFHETRHEGFTATLMRKIEKNVTPGARVVVAKGDSVENDYCRGEQRADLLLPYVERAIEYVEPRIRYGW